MGHPTNDFRTIPYDARARTIQFEGPWLVVQCQDGRELRVPVAWFPRLAQASAEDRQQWTITGDGWVVHWPVLDEDSHEPRA
ncbi:DUF2442 domain-containing protein [Sulfobacillus thermosulfidooxidans]|uniref:DUF2442 domain-containing protein n=1 Tax=Sulfobacillus thermosulfidooxidans TaxID=28034 RepID=UPI0006B4083E|nr:DUF2442 domain-containing protein [Sulfobacillus thermosulfidooxidans]